MTFHFYDYTFTEYTKVSEITKKYPWVLGLYKEMKLASSLGFTVARACSFGKISYEELKRVLAEYEEKYNEDGTLKK